MENSIERNYLQDEELIGLVGALVAQEERDRRYLEVFCQKFRTRLLRIDHTNENERSELMYFFDDNLGGYTIGGIINGLL